MSIASILKCCLFGVITWSLSKCCLYSMSLLKSSKCPTSRVVYEFGQVRKLFYQHATVLVDTAPSYV